jgi:uncharacterized membrane protein
MVTLRRALLVGSMGWAAVLPLAAFAASRPAPARAWYTAALLIYGMGSAICHQLASRSFALWAAQMPVCARCTGIYVGAALVSAFVALRLMTGGEAWVVSPRSVRAHRILFATATLPTVGTLLFEWTTRAVPSNVIRAGAGLPLGAAIMFVMLASLTDPHGVPADRLRSAVR